ncbi:hypothetical protein BHM03_00012685 [Ensete ventricosum]|nr:hypothetical protein BHM03_00012685 [Ensete ventricosum]
MGKKKKKRRIKKKKKRRRRGYIPPFPAPSSPMRRRCPRSWVVPVSSSPMGDSSPARGDGMSPHAGRKIEATYTDLQCEAFMARPA